MTVMERIHELLDRDGADYRVMHHEPTPTSEDSARVRGEPLETGGKALVMKVDDRFCVFVISAACKLDSKKVRRRLGARKCRFATPEELMERTGLVPGSVPPFGRPILDLKLYCDLSVTQRDRVAFNAGSLTDSIIIRVEDYLRAAKPEVFDFAKS